MGDREGQGERRSAGGEMGCLEWARLRRQSPTHPPTHQLVCAGLAGGLQANHHRLAAGQGLLGQLGAGGHLGLQHKREGGKMKAGGAGQH